MSTNRLIFVCVLLSGCGPSVGPRVDYVSSTTGSVGSEFALSIHATAEGGAIAFDFAAPDLPDLKKRRLPATITNYARGEAVFRWLPLAGDNGEHVIEFLVSSGNVETRYPVSITIEAGLDDLPVFREPSGEGTTVNLALDPCANIQVLVDDANHAEVLLDLFSPAVPNLDLIQTGPHEATLTFCPTKEQVVNSAVYVVTMVADDGANRVFKTYTMIVRSPRSDCTTLPPTIAPRLHGDSITTGNLHMKASVSDDLGVVATRVYWTTTTPASPIDLRTFERVPLALKSGNTLEGEYEGTIVNPIASQPSGTRATIYYVYWAQDDDPPFGCAHEVLAPSSGFLSFSVVIP